MATIRGLWFLNDSLITWEGLPIGYTNTININGRVWKNGVWQPFVSLAVTEHSEYTYLFKNDMVFRSSDGRYINIIDNGYQWWTGFTKDRVIDFGEEPQEMDDTIYSFITTNATQVEFNDVFMILNGNFKWKEVLQDGTNFNDDCIYINGEPEGETFEGFVFAIVTEELASALGLTPGVWGLGRGIRNTNTGEESVTGFYQNGVWSSEEARSFTLDNQTLPKTLALYILDNTEPIISKGPNYTALKNALDRLAAAIKNNIGGEEVYPFTIEEMCQIADGTMPTANEGEKGKEGFFYYMGKMADCIAERCGAELPLSIDEMIDALAPKKYTVTVKAYMENAGANIFRTSLSANGELLYVDDSTKLYHNGTEITSKEYVLNDVEEVTISRYETSFGAYRIDDGDIIYLDDGIFGGLDVNSVTIPITKDTVIYIGGGD